MHTGWLIWCWQSIVQYKWLLATTWIPVYCIKLHFRFNLTDFYGTILTVFPIPAEGHKLLLLLWLMVCILRTIQSDTTAGNHCRIILLTFWTQNNWLWFCILYFYQCSQMVNPQAISFRYETIVPRR